MFFMGGFFLGVDRRGDRSKYVLGSHAACVDSLKQSGTRVNHALFVAHAEPPQPHLQQPFCAAQQKAQIALMASAMFAASQIAAWFGENPRIEGLLKRMFMRRSCNDSLPVGCGFTLSVGGQSPQHPQFLNWSLGKTTQTMHLPTHHHRPPSRSEPAAATRADVGPDPRQPCCGGHHAA